jgi:hypothetical protein
MPKKKKDVTFQGKRPKPYTVAEIVEKTGMSDNGAKWRIKRAKQGLWSENKMFLKPRPKEPDNIINWEGEDTTPEVRQKLREFDKLTLPSERLLNKYFPDKRV